MSVPHQHFAGFLEKITMTLCLHAGAVPVSYDVLRNLDVPPGTETHVPIPHHRVVDIVRHMLGFYGHEIVQEAHGVTQDGQRYFGVLTLKSAYGDYSDMIGLRNSHDKKFPIGIAFGSQVFVCDNLAFSADHVVKRKHTARAKHELPALISEIVEPLALQRESQHTRLSRYKATDFTTQLVDHALMQLYRSDVLNIQRVPEVLHEWETPTHDWGEKTAWRLFNAVTFALAGRIVENPQSTKVLHNVIDSVIDIAH